MSGGAPGGGVLEGLDPSARKAILAAGRTVALKPGEYACREGDPPGELFFIREGRLRVTIQAAGEEVELAELGPENFFGEMSVLEDEPRSTSVRAIGDVVLVGISREALDELAWRAPAAATRVYRRVMVEMARRIRRTNQQLLERYRERSHEKDLMHLLVHDLRSPLAIAEAGAAQLLDRPERYGPLSAAQERVLRRIRRGHALARQLAEEVLEVGRSASGVTREERTTLEAIVLEAIPSALARVDAPALDESDLADLETLAGALEPHDIHIALPRDLARTPFLTDRLRLIQTLLNLVGNAVKHAPGYLRLEAQRDGGAIRISVADRGAGIPADFKSFIFERFRQADAKRSGLGRGFGFGLAAAKVLVESLGGKIWVESDPARAPGATFRFEVPFRAVP